MVPLRVTVAAAVSGGRLTGGSAVHRLSACGWDLLHGAATWCLLLPRTLKSSVGMLYGLFRIALVYGLFRIDFDVVVWQWQVNLSD